MFRNSVAALFHIVLASLARELGFNLLLKNLVDAKVLLSLRMTYLGTNKRKAV